MAKKERWRKPRHRLVRNLIYWPFYLYSKIKYGIKIEKFRDPQKRSYLILYNHQTAFDQFFVGMSFRDPVYYVASEDLFSNGFLSSLIRYLVAPIPINKQAVDIRAIKNCITVAKEGGTIAIAPEGNRTFSGKTEFMSSTIAPLARKLGLPIVLYHIEGGFGVHPRWSDAVRKGKMRAYVSRVIEPEEYAALSDDALFDLIRDGLFVNEAKADVTYRHKKRAEYIERVLYVCPFCGLSEFESHGDRFRCKRCEREVIYQETKELEGVGFSLPFRFLNDWYDYQNDFVWQMDLSPYTDAPIYCDRVTLSEVILRKKKTVLCEDAELCIYADRFTVGEDGADPLLLPFDEVRAVSVLGRNKLNIYHGKTVYQIKSDKRFNAVKYVNLFYRYKNREDKNTHGKFLGL